MKKVLKFILGIIGVLYLAVIIFATVCLLCYNQYKVTQMGDKTFIIIDDKSDMYKDGDLAVFVRNPNDEIVSGDVIFFYTVTNGVAKVNSGTVTKSEKITDTETTFTINNSLIISSETVIGKTETATIYHNVGKILYVFESQYGFLVLVILPALLLFFYAIYRVVKELKAPNNEEKSSDKQEATIVKPIEVNDSNVSEVKPTEEVSNVSDVKPTEVKEQEVSVETEVKGQDVLNAEPLKETLVTSMDAPSVSETKPIEEKLEAAASTEAGQNTSNDDIEYL